MELELNNYNLFSILEKEFEEVGLEIKFYTSLTEDYSIAVVFDENGVFELGFDRYAEPAVVLDAFIYYAEDVLADKYIESDKKVKVALDVFKKVRDEYQKTKNQLVNNQLEIDKIKGEIKNLMNSLAEAKSLAYQEIVREIERLSSVKVKLEEEMEHLKAQIDLMPFYSQSTIESNIIKLKSKIKKKTLEYIRPILRLLIKEIIITNEEIQTKLNLNAYVDEGSLRDFEVVIVENTDSIINPDNQLKQRLSWDALLIRI